MITILLIISVIGLFFSWVGYEITHPAKEKCHRCGGSYDGCNCIKKLQRKIREAV